MGKKEDAIAWITQRAEGNYGYSQVNRWGPTDYDCSSLVISAWEAAGVPLKSQYGATYTGNMKSACLSAGFTLVTDGTRIGGDILLNEVNHAAMMIDGSRLVQASCDENGGVRGDNPGEQGNEINIHSYYDFPWDCVLRYSEDDSSNAQTDSSNTYTVKSGDTLWGIAQTFGKTVSELMEYNNFGMAEAALLHPGQVIRLNGMGSISSSDSSSDAGDAVGQSSSEVTEYTVQSGDTLWGIAEKLLGSGLNYERLMVANNLTSSMIYPGQVLHIPT